MRNFGLEGSFDRETFLSRRGIYWQAVLGAKDKWEIKPSTCGTWAGNTLALIRRGAKALVSQMFGDDERREALLLALLKISDRTNDG